MHEYIEDGEKSQHASEARRPVPAGPEPERRYRKSNDQETQTPVTKSVLQVFDRVGAEIAGDSVDIANGVKRRDEAGKENGWLPYEANLANGIHRA